MLSDLFRHISLPTFLSVQWRCISYGWDKVFAAEKHACRNSSEALLSGILTCYLNHSQGGKHEDGTYQTTDPALEKYTNSL